MRIIPLDWSRDAALDGRVTCSVRIYVIARALDSLRPHRPCRTGPGRTGRGDPCSSREHGRTIRSVERRQSIVGILYRRHSAICCGLGSSETTTGALRAIVQFNDTAFTSMLTAQRCYVHFSTKLRFRYRVIARAFSHLWTKGEILIRYRNE